MMTISDGERKSLISNWIKHALSSDHMKQFKFDSIDVEELLRHPVAIFGSDKLDSIDTKRLAKSIPPLVDQVPLALQLYSELIAQYQPYADKFIAELIFNLEYVERLEIHSFEELMSGKVTLRQPPELYLGERHPLDLYSVVEEYKRSFTQEVIKPPSGVIYSYYHSLCDDDDSYTRSFVFQHHPKNSVQEIGREYIRPSCQRAMTP